MKWPTGRSQCQRQEPGAAVGLRPRSATGGVLRRFGRVHERGPELVELDTTLSGTGRVGPTRSVHHGADRLRADAGQSHPRGPFQTRLAHGTVLQRPFAALVGETRSVSTRLLRETRLKTLSMSMLLILIHQ